MRINIRVTIVHTWINYEFDKVEECGLLAHWMYLFPVSRIEKHREKFRAGHVHQSDLLVYTYSLFSIEQRSHFHNNTCPSYLLLKMRSHSQRKLCTSSELTWILVLLLPKTWAQTSASRTKRIAFLILPWNKPLHFIMRTRCCLVKSWNGENRPGNKLI